MKFLRDYRCPLYPSRLTRLGVRDNRKIDHYLPSIRGDPLVAASSGEGNEVFERNQWRGRVGKRITATNLRPLFRRANISAR